MPSDPWTSLQTQDLREQPRSRVIGEQPIRLDLLRERDGL